MDVSLDLKQRIDARFRDKQVLAIHLQYHESFAVQHDHPSSGPAAHGATARLRSGAAAVAMMPDRLLSDSGCADGRCSTFPQAELPGKLSSHGIRTPPALASAADACKETCRYAHDMSDDAHRQITPVLANTSWVFVTSDTGGEVRNTPDPCLAGRCKPGVSADWPPRK